ncbi:uncharacterized protein LOC118346079, partial [Juglans regia]|uniref:Uncharacterized protein LOC118346079 n=1 Tax=Juglans regia TaxID=51240 RepID=A0A6P9EFG0_JUGRE
MRKARNVFVRFSDEDDFLKSLSRESCDIEGVAYRPFQWSTNFTEDDEPSLVPVWIMLPGLPPNLYQEAFLRNIVAPIGIFLRRDNATHCATCTDGARVCVLMNIDHELIHSIWIGTPRHPTSIFQEIEYETLPAFCFVCKVQGHNVKTCKANKKEGKSSKSLKSPVLALEDVEIEVPVLDGGKDVGKSKLGSESVIAEMEAPEQRLICGEASGTLPAEELVFLPIITQELSAGVGGHLEPRREEFIEPIPVVEVAVQKDDAVVGGQLEPRRVEFIETSSVAEDAVQLESRIDVVSSGNIPVAEGEVQIDTVDLQMESKSEDEGKDHHPEPFRDDSQLNYWKMFLEFDECLSNANQEGKLWCFWKAGLKVEVMGVSDQHLTMLINSSLLISSVYAKCQFLDRRPLWSNLLGVNNLQFPHVIIGDFNVICNDNERRGGNPRMLIAMEDFCSFIDDGRFVEMPFSGNGFSWCNGRLGMARSWARLDRALCNSKFKDLYPSGRIQYLPRRTSDHSPMVLGHLVSSTSSWQVEVNGTGLWKLAAKLKRLKLVLKSWNKDVFGWTGKHIKELEAKVEEGELRLQECYSEDVEVDVLANKVELDVWLQREESRIAQQVKEKWVSQGEVSTAFFKALQNNKHNMVVEMKLSDGRVLNSPEDIHEAACVYFEDFLKAKATSSVPDLVGLISEEVSEEENQFFGSIPSVGEVKDALFSIPMDSSPGPDGFGSGFFQHCWSLVYQDLLEAVSDFFGGAVLPRFYSASFIVLIPKVQNPMSFGNFRPISLCSVELIHDINKPIRGGNIMMKIDFAKAYDTIDWGFLSHILKAFGFSPKEGLQFRKLSKFFVFMLSGLVNRWKIREGNVSFWRDNWLNSGPLMEQYQMVGDPELKVKDCMTNNNWAMEQLEQLVGSEKMEDIVNEVSSRRNGNDQLIWLENSDGSFTTKTAWSFVRIRNPNCQWSDWIWNSALPKKFSVLMWKALNSCLAVDDRIRRIGVPLVSKCECCRDGAIEDINHVLYSGNIAKAIWKFSSNILGIPFVPNRSWRAIVKPEYICLLPR